MNRQSLTPPGVVRSVLICSAFVLMALTLQAVDRGVTDTSASPHAKVRTVGLGEARWTHGLWADRSEACRRLMIPKMWSLMEGTQYSQFYQNFRISAGLEEGEHRGAQFNDGDLYKWLEGACAALAFAKDPELEGQIEEVISVIARAQRSDGYIHTPTLIRLRNGDADAKPFQDRFNFELYNMGHLLTAACVHYRVTGRTGLLAVARRAADFLDRSLREASPDAARSSVCPSHYMGLVELHRATREPRYLELAKRYFSLRDKVSAGGDDNQDRRRRRT